MDEDQAGPDPGESHVALVGLNPEPMHDDIMATVYPIVHESLKFLVDEHVIIEDPLSLTRTLSSMKNLDDAYTIEDQFLNDKSTEDGSRKLNVEAKVVSMQFTPHQDQPVKDTPMPDDVNISDSEDTDTAHLPKIKTKLDWLKPILEEDRPETPEPNWIILPTDLPKAENN
nr:hypothetical protein [Tanacetum cinerariifolium]